NRYDQVTDPIQRAECVGWLAQAAQIARALVVDPENVYRKNIEQRATQELTSGVNRQVREVASMLARLGDDLKAGYLGSQADRASAATFDDLLDHAQAYLADERREPAG